MNGNFNHIETTTFKDAVYHVCHKTTGGDFYDDEIVYLVVFPNEATGPYFTTLRGLLKYLVDGDDSEKEGEGTFDDFDDCMEE